MGYAPPLPATCDVKVVNVDAATIMFNPEYQMLGNIVVQSASNQDPFDEEMLSELRPRVCKMGGDALTLSMGMNVAGGGSGSTYMILKRKEGAPATPASSSPAPDSSGVQP